jgi:hypothetical protein
MLKVTSYCLCFLQVSSPYYILKVTSYCLCFCQFEVRITYWKSHPIVCVFVNSKSVLHVESRILLLFVFLSISSLYVGSHILLFVFLSISSVLHVESHILLFVSISSLYYTLKVTSCIFFLVFLSISNLYFNTCWKSHPPVKVKVADTIDPFTLNFTPSVKGRSRCLKRVINMLFR